MPRRVLITGANGYIGRHVAARLAGEGHEVLTLARQALSLPVRAGGQDGEPAAISDAASASPVLVHLAGVASRTHCPADLRASAAAFARRAIASAQAMGASSAILASSIYARAAEDGDEAKYGIHKREIEQLFEAEFCGRLVILRLPPVYGGSGDRSSIAVIAKLVGKGVPLPLGLARAGRDYLAMDNLVELVSALVADGDPALANKRQETYEPSDGGPVSTAKLVRHLGVAIGRRPLLIPIPAWAMRTLGAIVGKRALVEAAFAPLLTEGNGRIAQATGWVPRVAMPDSLGYVRQDSRA